MPDLTLRHCDLREAQAFVAAENRAPDRTITDEAVEETRNARADVGVVWAHRRGKASPADGYVVMTGDQFAWLLKSAGYGHPIEETK